MDELVLQFERRKDALETRGLKVNVSKTKVMGKSVRSLLTLTHVVSVEKESILSFLRNGARNYGSWGKELWMP